MISRTRLLVITFLIALTLTLQQACGQQSYSISSTEVVIFRDGVAQVRQIFSVNETVESISITLLSPSIQNVLVLDQGNTPLSYDIEQRNMSITTLGATKVTLEYLTSDLTRKEGSVWTLKINPPYNITITLPDQSNIIYLSDLPTSITSKNNRTVLTVPLGPWEISYIQQLIITPTPHPTTTTSSHTTTTSSVTTPSSTTQYPTTTFTSTTTTTTTTEARPTVPFPVEYLGGAVVVIVAVIGAFLLVKRRKANVDLMGLRPEDREVLQFISEKGGKVLESEIRQKFILPKSSTWRLVKRLERMGYVKIVKVGIQNEVELVKRT